MYDGNVFYDSDCLVCFLAVKQCGILQELFSKVIVPLVVKNEILNPATPQYIKDNFKKLVELDFVEVKEMEMGSREHTRYIELKNNYEFMGNGEAAVIALTHENGGVIASNNLSDVRRYVEEYDLNLITTAFILAKAYEKGVKTRKELDGIWKDMIKNGRKRSLPAKSFTQYYQGKYLDDMLYMGFG